MCGVDIIDMSEIERGVTVEEDLDALLEEGGADERRD